MTASKFPDLKYTAVGSFMFLRFICPAITSPAQYGILEGTVLLAPFAWLDVNCRAQRRRRRRCCVGSCWWQR